MTSVPMNLTAHLQPHAARVQAEPMAVRLTREAADPGPVLRVAGLYANFARQHADAGVRAALLALAERADVRGALHRLFDGETVNTSEGRAALHSALRSDVSAVPAVRALRTDVAAAREKKRQLREALAASGVTDVINVGIGGSDLGPRLVVDALRGVSDPRFRVHFLSNVDGHAAAALLPTLNPATTAVVLVSKSFGTQETLLNGRVLREWLGDDSRLYAVSANVPKAEAFGVAAARVLPMWDWVGGRYSLWSAVGFAIQLALGEERFQQLLDGAAAMDAHTREAPLAQNLPVWHALFSVWNRNGLGLATHAVLPYDDRLRLLPAYLQQLVMESLGKSVTPANAELPHHTVPVVWGGAGTDAQHSFFQALHQGTQAVPADLIGVVRPDHALEENHAVLLSHLLAQSEAFANGDATPEPQKRYPGSRPHSLLLLDALTPQSLGALIALYEHSVYVQSVLWGINAFDQWGVELGKHLATGLLPAVRGDADAAPPRDAITAALLAELKARR
jgi:glucose-6-phosphate isomerase